MSHREPSKIDVLVLSGGSGSRVGSEIKGLMPYNGRCALDYVLTPFYRDVFRINVNIRKEEEQAFRDEVDYRLFIEEKQIGNAGALKLFGKELSDPFIVIHNDVLVDGFDPLDFFIHHCKNITEKCCLTVVVKDIGKDREDGVIIKNEDAIIGLTRRRFINAGIYCVSHEALDYIESGEFQDIDDHLIQNLINEQRRDYIYDFNKRISAYEHKGHYESWGK